MSDIRYILKNGDPTSTGGKLISTLLNFLHHKDAIGLEGDTATCPACKSSGPVFNDCDPNFDVDGKQILVSGARVHCRCPQKPTVYNTQITSTVEVNRNGASSRTAQATYYRNLARNGSDDEIIEQYFEITGEDGRPIDGYRYDLFSDDSQFSHNNAMEGGRTLSVNGEHHLRIVMWLDKKGQDCA